MSLAVLSQLDAQAFQITILCGDFSREPYPPAALVPGFTKTESVMLAPPRVDSSKGPKPVKWQT